jgi:hypothetical protein
LNIGTLISSKSQLSPFHVVLKDVYTWLAKENAEEDIAKAVMYYKKAIQCLEQVYPSNHRHLASFYYQLVSLLKKIGDSELYTISQRLHNKLKVCCGETLSLVCAIISSLTSQ